MKKHTNPITRQSFIGLLFLMFIFGGCDLFDVEEVSRDVRIRRQISYNAIMSADEPNEYSPWVRVSGPVSLDDCLELAMIHNKDVQLGKQRLLEADGQMTEAIATALPTLSFSGSALWNDNSGFDRNRETYQLGLLLRQPIYLGGVIGTAINAAKVFTYQKQQELRQAIQTVQYDVRKSYLDVLLAKEKIAVAEQSLADARTHLTDTEKKLQYGTATRFELLQAQVNVTGIEAVFIQRQNDYELTLTRLRDSMGVSQSSNIGLTGDLQYEPQEIAVGESLSMALHQRPDLLIGEANIRLYESNLKAQKAGTRPRVYVQGQYARTYPGFSSNFESEDPCIPFDFGGGDDWERTMNAGFVVEWDIFDGFATDGKIAQAKAQLHQQRINLRKLEQKVQLDITQAFLNIKSGRKFVQSQQGNVSHAAEALRLARVGFQEGTRTSLDVISAETALAQARSDLLQAVHDYEMAKLSLDLATGTLGEIPLPTIEETKEQTNTK